MESPLSRVNEPDLDAPVSTDAARPADSSNPQTSNLNLAGTDCSWQPWGTRLTLASLQGLRGLRKQILILILQQPPLVNLTHASPPVKRTWSASPHFFSNPARELRFENCRLTTPASGESAYLCSQFVGWEAGYVCWYMIGRKRGRHHLGASFSQKPVRISVWNK